MGIRNWYTYFICICWSSWRRNLIIIWKYFDYPKKISWLSCKNILVNIRKYFYPHMKILWTLYKKKCTLLALSYSASAPGNISRGPLSSISPLLQFLFSRYFPWILIRFIRLPVEVTRTICRNSFLNQSTAIRPPNLWIATRPGWLSHTSSQGLETDCLSTRFIYTFIRFLDPKYFSRILNIFPFPFSQQRIQGAD